MPSPDVYWLALRRAHGVGPRTCKLLIEKFGSPEKIFQRQFKAGVAMLSQRDFFTATLLDSGEVLIPGGLIENATLGIVALETAEVYTP